MSDDDGVTATSVTIVRLFLVVSGALAIVWALAVIPFFWSEGSIVNIAKAITAGEAFKPEVLAAVQAPNETNSDLRLRSSVLDKAAMIRLRQAENAYRSGDPEIIKQKVELLKRSVRGALQNAPDNSLLWLVWFWVNGMRPDDVPFLRMSYDLGPYEGWIAVKRDRVALAAYPVLTSDIAERAVSEFVGLVRWGLTPDAADIAAGTAPPLRRILFARLKELSYEERRVFASAVYSRDLDDVPVPGIAPPTNQIPLPVLPPDFYSR